MKKTASWSVGLILVAGSVIASFVWHFPFWYSFYVVGAFMLFGILNYKRGRNSVYALLLEGKWSSFIRVYCAAAVFGFLVDIIHGRTIADLWYYPHLNDLGSIILPTLFYYPFGGLHIYELYYLLESTLSKKILLKAKSTFNKKTKVIIANALIAILLIGVLLTILNFFLNQNKLANELVTIFIILTIFSSDAFFYRLSGKSLLFDILEGNMVTMATMILTWFTAAVLTEVPNTYSWEWIYHKIPFISAEIFKINVLVFTVGWFFLVFFPIRLIDILLFYLKESKE